MSGAGDDCEAGCRLNAAQDAGALVEMGIGGRVPLTPDPVEPRPDLVVTLAKLYRTALDHLKEGSAIINWFRL